MSVRFSTCPGQRFCPRTSGRATGFTLIRAAACGTRVCADTHPGVRVSVSITFSAAPIIFKSLSCKR
ncbi:hypothetical protein C6Q28_25905 [Burkholderia multivorans]|uniref:Uncharacterized protein n=1 Tax=Burkholderia multivorans TaxID=87883 RepID=A0A228E159_9BURK|nr:hypothetical protein CA830_27765 [Burkholderia multivorans]OXH87082.1 hypothetical protein CA831_21935 [Burkholderia multivorans]PRE04872.1 hypothetical protein C6P91_15780 [Burkholderia multivorans]PRE76286.1 hypothetical protein C6Q02_22990 [Burkholderia multivorans]PRF03589.1 hypothetical protein C6Q07_19455 [Burkholderia multivorans]